MHILAIDQGTSNTKAIVFDGNGHVVSRASASCATQYPQPGWAEQSAAEIWATTRNVVNEACAGLDIACIGISNQRETLVIWDAVSGEPIGPAPIWQCRRTADACADLLRKGHGPAVEAMTGLGINPLFPATKLAWLLEHRPEARVAYQDGRLRAGTVDAWLLWNLTGGRVFATDHSNASRTLLFDTGALDWSKSLAEIFTVPIDCLPAPRPSDSSFGETALGVTDLPAGTPITAIMGDSHAALYGHGIHRPGAVKATYGTGSSLMTLTHERRASTNGLSGTIAWTASGKTHYALEGNITVSGQAAAFMSELLGLSDVAALAELAMTVPDSGGTTFVPALAGLGAPYWNDAARGVITGLSHGTSQAHLARAVLEAIAHQIVDVFEAMERDIGHPLDVLHADGGGSQNSSLMKLQADLLDRTVRCSDIQELSAFGAAKMAGKSLTGMDTSHDMPGMMFQSQMDAQVRKASRRAWRSAIECATTLGS